MLANEIIDVIFQHVLPIRIALPAYGFYFITNQVDDIAPACFQIARDFIPRGVGQNDVLIHAHILVGLHVIYHAANVRIELFLNGLQHFGRQVQPFAQADLHQELIDFGDGQLIEPHAHKFGLQRLVNPADVVAYQAKPHIVLGVIVVVAVQQMPQRHLRVLCHVIHFIQYDEFCAGPKEGFGCDKAVDLNADDVNAALVGGIQMNHEAAVGMGHGGQLVLVHQIHDGGGFPRAGGAVKQQVGKVPRRNDVAHHELVQRVQHNVVEIRWTIFFNPRCGTGCAGRAGRIGCAGRAGCAGRIGCAGCHLKVHLNMHLY